MLTKRIAQALALAVEAHDGENAKSLTSHSSRTPREGLQLHWTMAQLKNKR